MCGPSASGGLPRRVVVLVCERSSALGLHDGVFGLDGVLKRYVAREVYKLLPAPTTTATAPQPT